jgi:hypothetical protein
MTNYPSCQLCGGSDPYDTSIGNEKWNTVIRANGLPDFLCLSCIVREFLTRGESFSANLYGNGFCGEGISISLLDNKQPKQ